MSTADKEGVIDFDFFDDGAENDPTDNGKRSKIGSRHLSEERLHQHERIHSNNNTRPYFGNERVDLDSKVKASNSIGSTGPESESNGSESGSDGGQTSRTVSSRSTNISVKVPTAANDTVTDTDSDASGDESRSRKFAGRSSPDPITSTTDKSFQRSTAESKIAFQEIAKSRNHKKSWTSDDMSDNDMSRTSDSDSEFSSGSGDSDDDASVTDVSPLHSPESSRKYHGERTETEKNVEKKRKSDGVRFVEVTPEYSINDGNTTRPRDTEARELSMLLKAVLEMEECPTKSELDSFQKQMNRPASGKTRRGGSRPQSAHLPHHRMNMSFSNDEVRRIDRENQLLLGKIVNNKTHVPTVHDTKPPPKQLSHAAVRRMRERKRIESENMHILKRIETAKATPTVRKENVTRHYQKQVQYSNQVGKSPHRPSSGRRTGTTYANKMAKASSMTSLNSDFSRMSGATGSRPSSGRHSMVSDLGPPTQSRPAWDQHWHAG